MTQTDALTQIFNSLVRKYLFEECIQPDQTPEHCRYFMSATKRIETALMLSVLADIAHAVDEPELAGIIITAATELGIDGIPPMPL